MGYFRPPSYSSSVGGNYQRRSYNYMPTELPEPEKSYDFGQFVQRPDFDKLMGEGVNIAVGAGRAPGYVAERPLAWANTLTKGPGQEKGWIDQGLDFIRDIPVLGQGLGMVSDALMTPWAAKISNAPLASHLAQLRGVPDDTPLTSGGILVGGGGVRTVGDLRRTAAGRGFTPEDITDLAEGRKSAYDFGDKGVNENPLFNLGHALAFDPTNIALGVGLATKTPLGVGLLKKFWTVAGKTPPKAFEAWRAGRSLQNDWHAITLKGLAEEVGLASRGGQLAFRAGRLTTQASKAYFGTAVAATGAELGLTALQDAASNTPINPLTEMLGDFARRVQQDQPLSQGHLFSLLAAFKFPYHDTLQAARTRVKAIHYRTSGSDIIPHAVDVLVPPRAGVPTKVRTAEAYKMFGGELSFLQFVERIYSDFAKDKSHKFLKAVRPESQAELDYLVARSHESVERLMADMMARNEISGPQFVLKLKDIASNASEISELSGGVRFAWDPKLAARSWQEWQPLAATLAQVFDNRAPVVIGIMKDMPLPAEHITILRGELKAIADVNNGMVPRAYLNEVLHRYPQLLRDEPFRSKLGVYVTPDGPNAEIAALDKLLKNAEKKSAPLRDYLYEFRDWEQRATITMPKARARDPLTRRWSGAAAPPIGEAEVLAPTFLGARARSAGLRASTLAEAQELRGAAAAFEDAVPKVLDQAGYDVQSIVQQIGYSGARNELLSELQIALKPSASVYDELRQIAVATMRGGSRKVTGQADEASIVLSGRTATAVGKTPNALELRWDFGALTHEQANALTQLQRQFRAKLDDTRGVFRVWLRRDEVAGSRANELTEAIGRAVPEHPAIGKIAPSRHSVYLEVIANDARAGVRGADEVLSNVRGSVAADPRYVAAERYFAESRRTIGPIGRPGRPGLRRAGQADSAGTPSGGLGANVPRRVEDAWAEVERATESQAQTATALRTTLNGDRTIQAGMEGQSQALNLQMERANAEARESVDRFLAALHEEVNPAAIPDALGGLRAAVEARAGGNPLAPALDEALLRAHEDLVATGGNMGQVVFNAELDAMADTILPHLDRSLTDMPLALKQQIADFQRQLLIKNPKYVVKLPPMDVPYVYSTTTGRTLAANLRKQSEWAQSLFNWGPASAVTKFQRMLFSPRGAFANADRAKQALYNELLNRGATVAEINGFRRALGTHAESVRFGGARVFRSYDALPKSVYEDIALGRISVGKQGEKAVFKGFSDEVIANVGEGNFWKIIDKASSAWWRGTLDAVRAGGKRGELGRILQAAYPTGMGVRHHAKIWYHVFRFLTDLRWWAMNKMEPDILFGAKYGVAIRGAQRYSPSRAALVHEGGGDAVRALDALSTGWYDNRALLGPMSKVFDVEAPRSAQRFLDSLPETHEITRQMVARFGRDTKESWGKQLVDQIYSFDVKGVKQTVIEQARKQMSVDDFDILERSGILQRVWELNEKTFDDISRTIRGNPNRNLAERLGNSYWLYWPLSYQLKAGRWLYDTLTHRMFGRTTNLGGAWELSHINEVHQRLFEQDADYRSMFEDNPSSWFFAQMFVPITPFDLSVSLSRPAKVAGGVVGAWEPPSYSKDPFTFAAQVAAMGPIFTYEMLRRIGREQASFDEMLEPFRAKPAPPTQLGDYVWPQ